jgi:hypothetical protein
LLENDCAFLHTPSHAGEAMPAQLWPCPACSRHVERGDSICPFCAATIAVESIPTRTIARRLSRAALFAAGAVGVGVATTACGGKESTAPHSMDSAGSSTGASGSSNGVSAGTLYGGPFPIETEDSSASAGSSNGASAGGQPVYGAAVMPFETDDASTSDGPSDATADVANAGTSTEPVDSASTPDVLNVAVPYGLPPLPLDE